MDCIGQNPQILDDHINDDVLDYVRLVELIEFQRKNNPKLMGLSSADIAEACGMSESTYKALKNGKNRNPRVGTLVRLLKFIGQGSIDVLVRLAPRRNFRDEEAAYDQTLVETLQARLDAKRERIEEYIKQIADLEAEVERYRQLYHDALKEIGSLTQEHKQAEEAKIRTKKYGKWLTVAVLVLVVVLVVACILMLDFCDPTSGRIGEVKWR